MSDNNVTELQWDTDTLLEADPEDGDNVWWAVQIRKAEKNRHHFMYSYQLGLMVNNRFISHVRPMISIDDGVVYVTPSNKNKVVELIIAAEQYIVDQVQENLAKSLDERAQHARSAMKRASP